MPVADICRKAGISQATYFNLKKKYDGLLPTEMRRLKAARGRNRSCAKWSLISVLTEIQDALRLKPVRKRKLVDEMRGDWDVSIRRACRVFLVDTSTYR